MRRQRNMAQMKKQKKTPQKEINEGTTIKDIWTKPRWGVEAGDGGGDDWGVRGVVRGKCRQLYLNNNKIILKKKEMKWR